MTAWKLLFELLLTALLLAGCSNGATQAPAKPVDLGVVELSLGTSSRHELSGGYVCVLRAEALGPGTVELVALIEKSGKEVASTRVLPATLGRPVELSLGGFQVQVNPQLRR